MSDILSKVYMNEDEVHSIYASKHVKLVDNRYDTLDKEIDYIEKTLSDHYNSISNNTIFMNTTRSLLVSHTSDKDNPHNTTKAQVGLGNCNNTADNVKEVLSAAKWTVSRTLTIGSAGKNVNGLSNVTWSLAEIGAVNKNGDTMYGSLIMKKPSYVSSSDGTSAVAGYILVARITIKTAYATCPIEFEITNRHVPHSMKLAVAFLNENTNDPSLRSFTHYNSTEGAYLHKSAAGIWDIYVHKNDLYDNISITRYNTNIKYMDGLIDVTYPNTQVSELPSGYIKSTKLLDASVADKLAVPRKIGNATFDGTKNITVEEIGYDKKALMADVISMIYPIGSVKITFTNVNPGTTISGTTWTLISQGKYIRGVDPNNSSLNTAKTGGSNSINLSHNHSIAAHTHTLNHTHTIASHTHTIGHSHSVPGHAHTVNSHAHSTSGVTLSTTHMPSHGGHVAPWRSSRGQFGEAGRNGVYILTGQAGQGQRSGDWEVTAFDIYFGNELVPRCEIYGGDASHAHGNTGASAPATNSVALTTASGGGNSGGTALTTASGGGTTTGTALTTSSWNSTKTIEPEYQTLYFWRRTA